MASGAGGGLAEAAALGWREDATPRTLRRDARRWTAWTVAVSTPFFGAGALVFYLEPLTLPVALFSAAHGWAIPMLGARRGAQSVVPIGSERSASKAAGSNVRAERVAMGLLGDLVSHDQRDLVARTGCVVERGRYGTWVVGEEGAIQITSDGRRCFCWCVKIGDAQGLPGGDRVAHLLLALREDELGFIKVANLNFSGAPWRLRPHLSEPTREALSGAVKRERSR